jgi:hypothetical protein
MTEPGVSLDAAPNRRTATPPHAVAVEAAQGPALEASEAGQERSGVREVVLST